MMIGKRLYGLLLALLCLVAATPAIASYVTYYRVIGDWTVLCSQDSPGQGRQCSLSAPPPSIDLVGGRNELVIQETSPDVFRLAVQVRQVSPQGAKVTVKIDDFPAHETVLRAGSGAWVGTEATTIIRQGLAGQILVLGVQTNAGYREMRLSLIGFSKAIETYRRVVRSHGPL